VIENVNGARSTADRRRTREPGSWTQRADRHRADGGACRHRDFPADREKSDFVREWLPAEVENLLESVIWFKFRGSAGSGISGFGSGTAEEFGTAARGLVYFHEYLFDNCFFSI